MGTILLKLKPVLKLLPEIKTPALPPSFPERAGWTLAALLMFFAMYHIFALGVDPKFANTSDFLQVVTASRFGTLITTGIGPIVLSSIFLQLFVGAKILAVDMKDPEEKATFYGTQKLLSILLCFFEAYVFVIMSKLPLIALFGPITPFIVIAQIALGSIILLYLDEIVSKYGIGSGISLFIAAGVAFSIVGGMISIFFSDTGFFATLGEGGAQVIAKSLMTLMPIFFTVLVFLVIVYVEGIKIEIPLAFERARGVGTGFPIKFTYVSNIPVILALALLANFQFLAFALAGQHLCVAGAYDPALEKINPGEACGQNGIDLMNYVGRAIGGDGVVPKFADGFFYLISPMNRNFGHDYGAEVQFYAQTKTPYLGIPEWIHVVVYIIFLMCMCVLFGQFWVETTGMGPKDVAAQLDSAGLQIPGYRRDPRIVSTMLEKYIPPIVVMGSAFVGLLAGLADLTGALGTGTGILLTVGIIYKLYQDVERQNAFSQSTLMAKLIGR